MRVPPRGIPKITGSAPIWLQAAAMRGFPAWLRIVVGVVEVISGLALLIPGVAIYAALGLADPHGARRHHAADER